MKTGTKTSNNVIKLHQQREGKVIRYVGVVVAFLFILAVVFTVIEITKDPFLGKCISSTNSVMHVKVERMTKGKEYFVKGYLNTYAGRVGFENFVTKNLIKDAFKKGLVKYEKCNF